ncbi:MAG: CPXCG motif-containing cysteine-rich protein [Elusimicrobiota bacterium]|jgi:hypothetical protein
MPAIKKTRPAKANNPVKRKTSLPPEPATAEEDPPIDLTPPANTDDTVSTAEVLEHVPCPYCDEDMEVMVHPADDGKTRYESCSVCCRTVAMHIIWDDGQVELSADRC